ncbi:FkbM family methyltransferase [Ferroplasma acidiphilum]|uniref:FkbM family methyltransferase n=1 Tax=Ferroplasma acidiphilum TaxID=74969 RepID=A0A7K4FJS4_9ARCH|nr:FkbM family methyltransferase [Ferroplasma acidiphilum]NOL59266.1 FkbM family methyltransferase [Ferroplasma acidiphilum]
MGIKNTIDVRNRYKIAYKNYMSILWNIWRGRSKIKVIFNSGNSNYLNTNLAINYASLIANKHVHVYDLLSDSDGIQFTYNGKTITLEVEVGDIGAVFGREEYSFLKAENETVIDIGANIGDSPIYFALNNAKKVIALEPYPYSYNIALKNIKKNDIEDNIILLNAGYGQDGTIKVNPDYNNTTGSDLKSFDQGINVKKLSLKTILKDYNIDNAVLKMDCEGCEYNLLKEDNNTLKKFKRIQIEYHYGYKRLKEKLEDTGFTVTYSKSVNYHNKDAKGQNMDIGYIYAKLGV